MSSGAPRGHVYLVGAGPGAADLITLRARNLIRRAEVIVYDYLCNPALLERTRAEAEKIYVGKQAGAHTLSQEQINALLVERALAGKNVVRLKGGDPYVFGRGGEEGLALAHAGVPFEVVPGVTSAIAAPAYAGIPVTHRGLASTVTFVTGHEDPSKPDSAIDWHHLAGLRGTKVFLMGVEKLREIAGRLMAEGAASTTPAALVRWGTTARQESLAATLGTIADLAEKRAFAPPAITVVGDVVTLRDELNWFEALPLFGQRVVVTRTRRQASALGEALRRLGADVLEIPTIRIVPVPLGEKERAKLRCLPDYFDWLIFTSPNAVTEFFRAFDGLLLDIRALGRVRLAAVGPATAAHLNARHLQVELQPEIFTADNLAQALASHGLSGARFCLPQGNLAESHLSDALQKGGAQVETWTIYETQPETEDITGARARFLREGAHWITFTSASTVRNWHALQLHPEKAAIHPRAISIGPLTTAALHELDYEVAAEAARSDIHSLVATVVELSKK